MRWNDTKEWHDEWEETYKDHIKPLEDENKELKHRIRELEDRIKSMYNLAMQISEEVQKCKIK